MSEQQEDINMQQIVAKGLNAAALRASTATASATFPALRAGALTHILKPLSQAPVPITTISSAPSNPSNDTSGFQHKIPEFFYSPEFDTQAFKINLSTYALRLPAPHCNKVMAACRNANLLLDIHRARVIISDIESLSLPVTAEFAKTQNNIPAEDGVTYKRILLSSDVKSLDSSLLPSSLSAIVEECKGTIVPQNLTFEYDYFTADQALTALLPPDVVIPAGFAIVGHIAHVNLRDEQLPYKYVIGKILCDKSATVETVVNKVGAIDNVYRNFKAEILHGRPSLVTRVKEHMTTYEFDFSEVYWNSRLHTEHSRIVNFICDTVPGFETLTEKNAKNNDSKNQNQTQKHQKPVPRPDVVPPLVLDLFAGIGPFAVPAAQRKCVVYGNDLNPRSALYMFNNSVLNKAQSHLSAFNTCGRKMMQGVARQQMLQVLGNKLHGKTLNIHTDASKFKTFSDNINNCKYMPWFKHTIMNLPNTAVEFLDMYTGLYRDQDVSLLPRLPPKLTAEHACLISETPVTDVLHNCDDLNRLAIEKSGRVVSPNEEVVLNDGSVVVMESGEIRSPSYQDMKEQGFEFPIVHCYCFARNIDDAHGDALNQAEKYLGYRLGIHQVEGQRMFYDNIPVTDKSVKSADSALPAYYSSSYMEKQVDTYGVYIYHVRNVAPNKEMMCISFRLREDIMFALDSEYKGKFTDTPTLRRSTTETDKSEGKKRSSDEENDADNKKPRLA